MVMTSDMYHLLFERIRQEECMIIMPDRNKRNKKKGGDKK